MIEFVSFDAETELKNAVARYEASSGETLYPGDEHYMFLAQMVELFSAAFGAINSAANQNLLSGATGDVLDKYGDENETERIAAQKASVTMQFSVSAALTFDVTVPAGTRVTPDGTMIFALSADVVIAAGETSAQGTAVAEEAGADYNGFLPGQINSMIDLVEYVGAAENVTTSAGGSDEEDDNSYREQIRLSREAISTAGSKESYEYWAKTASADIVDAKAVKTGDGQVTVYLLMSGAAGPTQEVLDKAAAACTPKKRRPITDSVTVSGAETVAYDITLTYYISSARSTEESTIKAAVEQAVTDFAAAQTQQLGGNLNPDDLRNALLAAGAYRIDLTAPAFTVLENSQVAVAGTQTITYGGLL